MKRIFVLIAAIFIGAGLYTYFSSNPFQFTIALLGFGIISTTPLIYNFRTWKQFVIIFISWFFIIFSIANFFVDSKIPYTDIGSWFLYYPSIIILYLIIRFHKDEGWDELENTSIAAMDTLFVFGVMILILSGLDSFSRQPIGIGFTQDWREFYLHGVGMIIYVAYMRDKYELKIIPWMKKIAIYSGLISGFFLILESIVNLIFFNRGMVNFALEAALGIIVVFFVYRIKHPHPDETKKEKLAHSIT